MNFIQHWNFKSLWLFCAAVFVIVYSRVLKGSFTNNVWSKRRYLDLEKLDFWGLDFFRSLWVAQETVSWTQIYSNCWNVTCEQPLMWKHIFTDPTTNYEFAFIHGKFSLVASHFSRKNVLLIGFLACKLLKNIFLP